MKRAEEAAGSFSARTLGPRCVPRPRPLREKSTPSHPLHTLLIVLLVPLCRERSRLRIPSPSSRPRLLSHLSLQRGILRSERNKEMPSFRPLSIGPTIAIDMRRFSTTTQQLNQLQQPHSLHVLILIFKNGLSTADATIARKYRYGIIADCNSLWISQKVHSFLDCSRLNDV